MAARLPLFTRNSARRKLQTRITIRGSGSTDQLRQRKSVAGKQPRVSKFMLFLSSLGSLELTHAERIRDSHFRSQTSSRLRLQPSAPIGADLTQPTNRHQKPTTSRIISFSVNNGHKIAIPVAATRAQSHYRAQNTTLPWVSLGLELNVELARPPVAAIGQVRLDDIEIEIDSDDQLS